MYETLSRYANNIPQVGRFVKSFSRINGDKELPDYTQRVFCVFSWSKRPVRPVRMEGRGGERVERPVLTDAKGLPSISGVTIPQVSETYDGPIGTETRGRRWL